MDWSLPALPFLIISILHFTCENEYVCGMQVTEQSKDGNTPSSKCNCRGIEIGKRGVEEREKKKNEEKEKYSTRSFVYEMKSGM